MRRGNLGAVPRLELVDPFGRDIGCGRVGVVYVDSVSSQTRAVAVAVWPIPSSISRTVSSEFARNMIGRTCGRKSAPAPGGHVQPKALACAALGADGDEAVNLARQRWHPRKSATFVEGLMGKEGEDTGRSDMSGNGPRTWSVEIGARPSRRRLRSARRAALLRLPPLR